MNKPKVLASIFLALGLSPAAQADDTIAAQPITLSASVGNDQRDFFITSKKGDDYVVFDGALPLKPSKGVARDSRVLYSVKVGIPGTFFDVVDKKLSPLKKLAAYTVPHGTVFNTLLMSDISSDESNVREVFVVPTKGIYITANDGAPRVLHAGPATAPITGAALRFPGNSPSDTDKAEQFRVIFGGTDGKKGVEPFQSTGTSSGKLLTDIIAGKGGSSDPANFTTYNNEVYFLATSDTASGLRDVFKVVVNTSGKKPVYSAVNTSHGELAGLSDLTGGSAGLFANFNDSGTIELIYSTDGTSFFNVQLAGTSANIIDAIQFTPTIDQSLGDFGFSAFDTAHSVTRFGIFSSFNGDAIFPEDSNASSVVTVNPYDITSTGNYYYFGATVSGSSRLVRHPTGGSDLEYITTQNPGNYVRNVQEMVDVPSGTSGTLYFTADALVDSVQQTGILFSMDPDSADPVAIPVRTIAGNTVQGAHNLSSVDNNVIFRLYFSAPVNSTTNTEYDQGGTDYGTKPWVVNAP